MVLKADWAGFGAIGKLSAAGEIVSVHVHAVEHDDDFVVTVDDAHLIPLAGRFGSVSMRFDSGDDAFATEKLGHWDPVLRFLAKGFIKENGPTDVLAQALR